MNRYRYAFRKAFTFSRKEFWPFMISVVFSGFILAYIKFMYWNQDVLLINLTDGITNFILYTLLFLIIYFIFIAAQKFVAAYMGYECTIEIWYYGPVIGLFVTFMTFGLVPFLYLGNVKLKEDPNLRLGKFRYYLNIKDLMYVGIAGPLAVILFLILIIQPLYFATQASVLKDVVRAASWIILFSSLPLPKTNGINVLLKSRTIWLIYFIFSIGMFILLWQLKVATYIAAFIIGVAAIWLIIKIARSKLFN